MGRYGGAVGEESWARCANGSDLDGEMREIRVSLISRYRTEQDEGRRRQGCQDGEAHLQPGI